MSENKSDEDIIMYGSDRAARFVTIHGFKETPLTGWMDRFGKYWGHNESAARYSGCTHQICDCEGIMTRGYTKCEDCRRAAARERYLALPFKEWDGVSPVVINDGDEYFWDEDGIYEYCENNDYDDGFEVDLIWAIPHKLACVSEDYWTDHMPEEWEMSRLSKEVSEALTALNSAIKEYNKAPKTFEVGKIRTSYTYHKKNQ